MPAPAPTFRLSYPRVAALFGGSAADFHAFLASTGDAPSLSTVRTWASTGAIPGLWTVPILVRLIDHDKLPEGQNLADLRHYVEAVGEDEPCPM